LLVIAVFAKILSLNASLILAQMLISFSLSLLDQFAKGHWIVRLSFFVVEGTRQFILASYLVPRVSYLSLSDLEDRNCIHND